MVHETYKLINTIKKMYPVIEFLHNRYFPDSKVYYAEKALIETKEREGRLLHLWCLWLAALRWKAKDTGHMK